jgi:hypothetical protein
MVRLGSRLLVVEADLISFLSLVWEDLCFENGIPAETCREFR